VPHDRDRPAVGPHQTGERRDQRGLARAVGAEQAEELALANLEIDAAERLQGPETSAAESTWVTPADRSTTMSAARHASTALLQPEAPTPWQLA
jgi:hypothetical protein